MEFRSIFRRPPGDTVPLLPLHNRPSRASSVSFPSLSPPKSQYQTAPQSPDLQPVAYPFQRVSLVNHPPPTMSSLIPRLPIHQSDTQIALHRQQNHLESHLQTLLDAQSEGLLAGLGGGAPSSPQDDRASSTSGRSASRSTTGTATPTSTTRSSRITWAPPGAERDLDDAAAEGRRVIPVRQPKPRRIGLRSARRGISRTMAELAVLKTQEAEALDVEIDRRDEVLAAARRIADKEAGLRAQIRQIEDEAGGEQRLQGLKSEEREVDAEIRAVETRLYEMKARQRVLRLEISGLENRVQAKLSSYRNALALAEKEARGFLARPPLEAERGGAAARAEKTGVWALPKERRTLEMLKEHYGEEEEALKAQIDGLEKEREALEEGGLVWREVVEAVMGVEEALRLEMKTMRAETQESGMKRLLGRMGEAVESIREKLVVADEKGWNLLVAAIGAEVEALGEGHRVLEGTLRHVSGGELNEELLEVSTGDAHDSSGRQNIGESGIENLGNGERPNTEGPLLDGFDESDGPGPDLLIEEHEDD